MSPFLRLKAIIEKASGWTPRKAGGFFGWVGQRVTKGPSDFTREQLIHNGFTKRVLESMADAYEKIARAPSPKGNINPSAAIRAKQLRELVDQLF